MIKNRMYSKKVFLLPYLAIFAIIGIVGVQLLRPSSAAPLIKDDVTLRMTQPSYRTTDVVRFTLTNQSNTTITVANNCPEEPLRVYRRENGAWKQLHSRANESRCPNTLRTYDIAPHTSTTVGYNAWPDLFAQPGHYRLVAPLEQQSLQPSVEFDVTE